MSVVYSGSTEVSEIELALTHQNQHNRTQWEKDERNVRPKKLPAWTFYVKMLQKKRKLPQSLLSLIEKDTVKKHSTKTNLNAQAAVMTRVMSSLAVNSTSSSNHQEQDSHNVNRFTCRQNREILNKNTSVKSIIDDNQMVSFNQTWNRDQKEKQMGFPQLCDLNVESEKEERSKNEYVTPLKFDSSDGSTASRFSLRQKATKSLPHFTKNNCDVDDEVTKEISFNAKKNRKCEKYKSNQLENTYEESSNKSCVSSNTSATSECNVVSHVNLNTSEKHHVRSGGTKMSRLNRLNTARNKANLIIDNKNAAETSNALAIKAKISSEESYEDSPIYLDLESPCENTDVDQGLHNMSGKVMDNSTTSIKDCRVMISPLYSKVNNLKIMAQSNKKIKEQILFSEQSDSSQKRCRENSLQNEVVCKQVKISDTIIADSNKFLKFDVENIDTGSCSYSQTRVLQNIKHPCKKKFHSVELNKSLNDNKTKTFSSQILLTETNEGDFSQNMPSISHSSMSSSVNSDTIDDNSEKQSLSYTKSIGKKSVTFSSPLTQSNQSSSCEYFNIEVSFDDCTLNESQDKTAEEAYAKALKALLEHDPLESAFTSPININKTNNKNEVNVNNGLDTSLTFRLQSKIELETPSIQCVPSQSLDSFANDSFGESTPYSNNCVHDEVTNIDNKLQKNTSPTINPKYSFSSRYISKKKKVPTATLR